MERAGNRWRYSSRIASFTDHSTPTTTTECSSRSYPTTITTTYYLLPTTYSSPLGLYFSTYKYHYLARDPLHYSLLYRTTLSPHTQTQIYPLSCGIAVLEQRQKVQSTMSSSYDNVMAESMTMHSDSETYDANHDLSDSHEEESSSSSPMILYSPPTIWGLLRGAGINLLLPFVNGLMLGFGELFANELAFRFGWSGTKVGLSILSLYHD